MAIEYGESDLRVRYEKYRRILDNLTIMDDIFMRNVLNQPACTEYLLQIIMQNEELKLLDCMVQKDFKNLQGRSVYMDCVAQDTEKCRYDVEVQQDNGGASFKRARYHSSLMDMHSLEPGQNFDGLPEHFVIFITREDVLGSGLQIYHADRILRETGEDFSDDSHIIYVNAAIQDDTRLGRLMHDLFCKHADEMYSEVLAKRVKELKETERGVEHMCRAMDELYHEGKEEGRNEGKREMALSMAEMGISAEKIAQAAKESVSLVRQWISEGAVPVK